jgi:DNA-directed RNA polymerase subunit RPC12/RpoP
MSEFKYACPVCGQHMMCDSSQSGTVMECPTCFQKITAPQAPASDDQKFILTGTKVGERPPPKIITGSSTYAPTTKNPLPVILLLTVFAGAVAAGIFVFRGKIFGSGGSGTQTNAIASAAANGQSPQAQVPARHVLVAPPASDTNWTLNLDRATNFPAVPLAGRIHALDFIVERAYFQNGILTLREGARGPLEFGCTINFSGAQAEALSGQTINVTTNADTAARVSLRWKNDADSGRDNFASGYAMRLEFGALANNHLLGKIYLCTPDAEKSYLLGIFNADARKPKPKGPKK